MTEERPWNHDFMDRPETPEQAMELSLDWATGKRSWNNLLHDVEGISSNGFNRQETLRIINEMDCRTAEMWARIAGEMSRG